MPLKKKPVLQEVSAEEKTEVETEIQKQREHLEIVASWPKWRRKARRIVEHRYFEYVVWAGIGIICFSLCVENVAVMKPAADTLNIIGDCLVWVYVAEIVMRYIATGRSEFTRHWWNIFDVVLVLVSIVGFFMDFASPARAARSLRVARPLRTLSSSGPMKVVVEAIVICARKFLYVSLLSLVFVSVLTFSSMYLFRSDMTFRCVSLDLALVYQTNISRMTLTDESSCVSSSFPDNYSFDNDSLALLTSGLHRIVASSDQLPPDPAGTVCDYGSLCIATYSIESGYSNFDTFVTTQSTLFSLLLPDDYGDVMFQLMDNHGWIASYFTFPILALGTFFVLTLPLAVVVDGFNRAEKKKKALSEEHGVRDNILPDGCDDEEDDNNSFLQFSKLRRFTISPEDFSEWFGTRTFSIRQKIVDARLFLRRRVICRPWFQHLTVSVIIANTLLLATVYAGMSDEHRNVIEKLSVVFVFFYVLEMSANLFAIPLSVWITDKMNVFDLLVTLASATDLFWTQGGFVGMLRVVRLFRLLTAFRPLRRTTKMLIEGLKNSWPLMLVLIVLLVLFSIVGVQIFSGTMCGLGKDLPFSVETTLCTDVPRANFDNVGYAFTFLLTVAAGDGWRPLANVVSCASDSEYPAYFFIICRVICGYLFLNLFVATLTYTNVTAPVTNEVLVLFPVLDESMQLATDSSMHREESVELASWSPPANSVADFSEPYVDVSPVATTKLQEESAALKKLEERLLGDVYRGAPLSSGSKLRSMASSIIASSAYLYVSSFLSILSIFTVAVYVPTSYPDHWMNVLQQVLDVVFAVFFTAEAAMLMLHLHLWEWQFFDPEIGDIVVRGGYFQNPWRLFEFALLLCNIVAALLVPCSSLPSVRPRYRYVAEWLRIARSLRVWTIITKFKSLSLIFSSLARSAPALLHAGIITFFVFVSFSIMGTQLFMGDINACQDKAWGDVTFGPPYLQNKTDCLNRSFVWRTAPQNFDNALNSFATLFQVAVRSEWTSIVWAATDGSGPDTAPKQLSSPWAPLFFFVFVLLVSFFQVNVFVASMIDAYFATKTVAQENLALLRVAKQRHRKKKSRSSFALMLSPSLLHSESSAGFSAPEGDADLEEAYEIDELTINEKDFYTMYHRALFYMRPPLLVTYSPGSVMWAIRKFVRSPHYEQLQFGLVLVQLCFLTISFSRLGGSVSESTLTVENTILNILIAILTSLKALVTGLRSYVKQRRNCVDTVINIVVLAGDVIRILGVSSSVSDALRLIQLVRLYRLAFLSNGIMLLLRTLSGSLKNFCIAFFVLSIVVFQFACIGQVLFGRVKWTTRNGLFRWSHFDRFDVAVYTLVRVGIGAAGLSLMETNCAVSPPDCDPNIGDCGWPIVAPLFKIVFMIFVNWIGVNLVSAVLLESLTNSEREELFAIKLEDVDDFCRSWKYVAATDQSKAFVSVRELWSLLLRLHGGAFAVSTSPLLAMMQLGKIPLRHFCGQPVVFKRHVFHALVSTLYGVELPPWHSLSLIRILESRFRDLEQEAALMAEPFSLDYLAAIILMQRLFRRRRRIQRSLSNRLV
jgi:hypothetical protein